MHGMVRRSILLLVGVQAADAVAVAIPLPILQRDLDRLGLPRQARPVIVSAKALSAVGLAAGLKQPKVGVLASNALLFYFLLAIGAHARLSDEPWRYAAAVAMFAWTFAALRAFRHELVASDS
jgi:hypothetical protein